MQEMKTAVKAVAATAVGALMLGATLAGAAMAATSLGDFPTPFVKDGSWSGKIVVGKVAATEDVVGALDIAAALGQKTVALEAAAGAGTVDLSISGTQGKQFDIPFGIATDASAYFGSKLTATDMPMLFDGKARSTGTGTQFRVHEEVSVDSFDASQTSRVKIYEDESKMKMDLQQLSLAYRLIFDDQVSDPNSDGTLSCTDFATATTNSLKKIEVPSFLGKKLTFTCINTTATGTTSTWGSAGTSYITVEQGDYQTLKPGDSYKSGDYTVKVQSVDTSSSTGKTSVQVTGPTGNTESKILSEGDSYQFLSGGIEVKANAVIKDAAELIIGSTVSKTINNNDAEGWYGNKDYRVNVGSTPGDVRKPAIGLYYKYPYGTTERTGVNALNIGDKVDFINGAFQLKYVSNKATLASDPLKIEQTNDLAFQNLTQAATSVAVVKVSWPSTADVYTAPVSTVDATNVTANSASSSAERSNYMLLYTPDGGRRITVSYQDTKGTMKFASNYIAGNVTLTDGGRLASAAAFGVTAAQNVTSFNAKIVDAKYKDTPFSLWLNTTYAAPNSTALPHQGTPTVYLYVNASTTDGFYDIVTVRLMHSGTTFTRVGSSTTPVDADAYYAPASILGGDDFAATGGSPIATTYDKAIGAKDKDYITLFGMKVSAPKTSLGSGNGVLNIYLPDTQDKAKILVGKQATTSYKAKKKGDTVSGVTVDDVSVTGASKATSVPISVPVASLDTEITDKTANNMILVGGPSVNSLVKDLGMTKEDFKDASGNAIGKLVLKDGGFAAGKQVLVVAGWDAANTRAASYVLAHYSSYMDQLKDKTEVAVSGTELTTSALTVA